jgi:SAM-dependent methyltransferase
VSFDVAADAYDQFMGRWSRPLAPQLADLAAVRPGQRLLDVGCGPGALTTELVARVGPGAVAAIDPSGSFVEAARARNPGVDVHQGTAEALPFAGSVFDAALAQLVVHFMADPVAGLREMGRVTRPGGIVAACVWDYAGGNGPLGPFWVAARDLDPTVEDETRLAGTSDGHLAALAASAGLGEVEGSTLQVSRDYAGFDEWWEPFTRGVGPAGSYVARLDAEQRAAIRARCRSMLSTGPITIVARAWAARGVAPGPTSPGQAPRTVG